MCNTAQWNLKNKAASRSYKHVRGDVLFHPSNINSSPSLCCFFSHSGRSPPILRWALASQPHAPVHSRALETGWDRLTRVISSCHWDIYLHVPFPGLSPQDYDSLDMKQRRCSSPGYIDSPTYSRQGMSPIMPRSPQHYGYLGESAVTPADMGILYLTTKRERVWWQSFTAHFKVQQEWWTFRFSFRAFYFILFINLVRSNCQRKISTFRFASSIDVDHGDVTW